MATVTTESLKQELIGHHTRLIMKLEQDYSAFFQQALRQKTMILLKMQEHFNAEMNRIHLFESTEAAAIAAKQTTINTSANKNEETIIDMPAPHSKKRKLNPNLHDEDLSARVRLTENQAQQLPAKKAKRKKKPTHTQRVVAYLVCSLKSCVERKEPVSLKTVAAITDFVYKSLASVKAGKAFARIAWKSKYVNSVFAALLCAIDAEQLPWPAMCSKCSLRVVYDSSLCSVLQSVIDSTGNISIDNEVNAKEFARLLRRLKLWMAQQRSKKQSGKVKWFSSKGYGFIVPDSGEADVFVHQSAVHAKGFRSLAEGEPVEFNTEVNERGKTTAINVTGPNGAFVKGTPKPMKVAEDESLCTNTRIILAKFVSAFENKGNVLIWLKTLREMSVEQFAIIKNEDKFVRCLKKLRSDDKFKNLCTEVLKKM